MKRRRRVAYLARRKEAINELVSSKPKASTKSKPAKAKPAKLTLFFFTITPIIVIAAINAVAAPTNFHIPSIKLRTYLVLTKMKHLAFKLMAKVLV